ncbi:type II secretion system protein GspC [Chromatiales bacterium (ex Bugula neritina AB1)]|nr:type II secretion system protein GspC [Chromatiales bacterium (ex Bugula neritina AB1)]
MAKLAPWVSRVLVILIGYLGGLIAIRFVPIETTFASVTTTPLEVPAVATPSVAEIANGAARDHIFGEAGSKPVAKVTRTTEAPVTKLNLSLVGVYSAKPADRALAIISANGKPEEVYRIGETITGRAILKEVLQNQVIIDNGGRSEIVKLPEKVASTGRNTGMENLPTANLNPQGGSNAPIELPQSPKEIRDTLARNPAMLNKLVSAVPYRENGRILGYRLTPKQDGSLLEQNGVLPGDVVTRVNGIALANQKNGIRALRKLVKASSVDLTILRDGIEIPISIPLQ